MEDERTSNYKSKLLSILKIVIAFLMVYYIINYLDIDFAEVFSKLYSISLGYVVLFIFFLLLIEYIQCYVMYYLLFPHSIYLTRFYIYRVNLTSMFYSTFMPIGKLTGGAIRWHKFSKGNKKRKEVFAAIIIQNVLQVFFYVLFSVFVFIYNNPLDERYHFISYILSLFMAFLIILFLLVLVNASIQSFLYSKVIEPLSMLLPKLLRERFYILWDTIFEYSKERKALPKAFSYTVVYMFGQLLFYYFLALRLDIDISFFEVASLFIVSGFLLYVPLPLSGLGARELLFISLCASYGVSKEEALLYSLLIFAFLVVLSIIGGFVELVEHSLVRLSKKT